MVSFTDCINRITEDHEAATLLENKATYKQMMQGVIQALQQADPSEAQDVQRQVGAYIKTFQRSDRIIWILRWYRAYLSKFIPAVVKTSQLLDDQGKAAVNKWADKASKKYFAELQTNMPNADVENISNDVMRTNFTNNMVHYLSYTDESSGRYIDKIARTTFTWQTPDEILRDFGAYEREWQDNRGREMDHAEDFYGNAEMIMDFGDGFAWWNLNEEYCDAEGNAMGHCGNNQGRGGTGDRVLSLRQEIVRGDQRKHIPYLTFILDIDNNLGEMKGRANEKPKERYHKYIVPLILSDLVEGIKGGGHDPANNFTLSDLDPDQQEKIIDAKPHLAGAAWVFRKEGLTSKVKDMVTDDLDREGMSDIYGWDGGDNFVILAHYDDLDDLSREIHWDVLDTAKELYDERNEEVDVTFDDDDIRTLDLPADVIEEIIGFLGDRYLQRIADDLGIEGDPYDFKTRQKMADAFTQSRYANLMAEGILVVDAEDTTGSNIADEDWTKYFENVLEVLQSGLQISEAYLKSEDDGSYTLRLDIQKFFSILDATEEEDYEDYYYYKQYAQQDGWDSFDTYSADDYWQNYVKGEEEWQKDASAVIKRVHGSLGLSDDSSSEIDVRKVDPRQVAKWFMDEIDVRESEEDDTDDMIMEMMRRAGLR